MVLMSSGQVYFGYEIHSEFIPKVTGGIGSGAPDNNTMYNINFVQLQQRTLLKKIASPSSQTDQ